MYRRIFLLMLSVASLVMLGIAFFAYSWLGSIGDPSIASASYVSNTTYGWAFLWISFIAFALISVFLTWRSGAKWPVIATYGYFVVFLLALLFNDSSFETFLNENNLKTGYILLNPFFVAVILLVIAVFLIASYMMTINIRVKIKKESKKPEEEEIEDSAEGPE